MSRGSAATSATASTVLSLLAAFAVLHSCVYDWEAAGGGPTTQPTTSTPTSSTSTAGAGGSSAAAGSGGGATGGAGNAGASTTGGGPSVVDAGGGAPCSPEEFVCGEQLLCCARETEFCQLILNSDSAACPPCTGCSPDGTDPCGYVLGNLVTEEECPGANCVAGMADSADEGAIWVTCP